MYLKKRFSGEVKAGSSICTIRPVFFCSSGSESAQLFCSSACSPQFLGISAVFVKAVYVAFLFGYFLLDFC